MYSTAVGWVCAALATICECRLTVAARLSDLLFTGRFDPCILDSGRSQPKLRP